MYIDYAYYTEEYNGFPVDNDEFDRLAQRSSDTIDTLTHNRIQDLEKWPENIQKQIKKATAAQVEYYAMSGGYESVAVTNLNNVSIGSFSYGSDGSLQKETSPKVIDFLKPTGLLYSGVGVINASYPC